MATSTYFQKFDNVNEQTLLENIIIESIRIYGHDVFYLPRSTANLDNLLGEDALSSFDAAHPIEMYIKSVDGFEGEGSFISKFGLEVRQQVTFSLARSAWSSLGLSTTPKEGDLVYFPLTKKLFEIQFVDHESVFYQTGALQTYDLQCELFEYSDEDLDTGIASIDKIEADNAYVETFPITMLDQGFIGMEDGGFIMQDGEIGQVYSEATEKIIINTIPQFEDNELITGISSETTANITAANTTHVTVTNISNKFTIGETIIGSSSEAKASLGTRVQTSDQQLTNDPAAKNVVIETIADGIIDFSEDNPFSEDI